MGGWAGQPKWPSARIRPVRRPRVGAGRLSVLASLVSPKGCKRLIRRQPPSRLVDLAVDPARCRYSWSALLLALVGLGLGCPNASRRRCAQARPNSLAPTPRREKRCAAFVADAGGCWTVWATWSRARPWRRRQARFLAALPKTRTQRQRSKTL